MLIKNLFDPARDIYRTIEKVITYNASQEARLRAEITEYIVTDSIEEQCEKLLSKMQTAMDLGGKTRLASGSQGSMDREKVRLQSTWAWRWMNACRWMGFVS